MVARKMSSAQAAVAKSPNQSRVDRFLHMQLLKLQLRRRIDTPHVLIPRMDLFQDDALPSTYAIFEIPGVSERSIKVDVEDGLLTIEGMRGPPLRARLNDIIRSRVAVDEDRCIPEFTLAEEKYRARELNFGIFRRKVQLPPGVKASDVRHELRDGMLLVTWPTGCTPTAISPVVNLASMQGTI
ncbi:hypothetical protein BXZ70DRAFT_931753 [Cristinia sonorae]|uniref:SHSP domain-containing protein n=1 Tax=Cristinia sonorae TaxID=1940300 RepID=A0A8K0XR23_9AGAR|nr:hypothetical protein BXZ70DRAFT_931753 [Cristinia sonorae]